MRGATILSSILVLAACNMTGAHDEIQPSGKMGKKQYQVGGFDKVALAGPHNVVVTVGGAPSVRAEGDTGLLDRLDIRVEGGELKIDTHHKGWFSWHKVSGPPVTVYVTVPTLAGASIGGSGDMRIDKVEGERFSAAIGGSGDMAIGPMKVTAADFAVAGSGGITASGTADQSKFSIAGSGDVDAGGLRNRSATVSIAGSGKVNTQATESAEVSVMGSGDVTISGPAKCKINKMGSGDVRCGG
jgi:hypothetical protein